MAYNNDKICKGLNCKYAEKIKEKKPQYKAVNDKKVVSADYNGNSAYKQLSEGLSAKEKKADVKEISFKEEFTSNRKYIDEIFNSKNVNETILLINSMQKRAQELRGYLLSNLVSRREEAEKELADINYVFEKYADKIEYLVENNVLQRSSSSDSLFRVE